MQPYEELTRLGRLRRLRKLAEAALAEYGLSGAKLTFLHYGGNLIFRVDALGSQRIPPVESVYLPNRYVLRVLTMGNEDAISSELTWLTALSHEAGLPAPLPTLDGRLLTKIATPGVPQGMVISLMRWVDGRRLQKGFRPYHFCAWGQMMARLHNFAAAWQAPDGFSRFHWDWEGQLGGREFSRYSMDELVASIPDEYREAFQAVSLKARQVMESLGKGADAYGLIHADMYPENVLFKAGEAYPIDFEDCGYGYWMWDIATALCSWPWTEEFYWMRDAFLEGYVQVRSLPDTQLQHLNLFMAAQYATMVLWATVFIRHDPPMQAEHEAWRHKDGKRLLRYFERGG